MIRPQCVCGQTPRERVSALYGTPLPRRLWRAVLFPNSRGPTPRQARHLRSCPRLHVLGTAVEPGAGSGVDDDLGPSASGRPSEHGMDQLRQQVEVPMTPRRIMNRKIKACVLPITQLCDLIQRESSAFDHVNTSHALHRLARQYQDIIAAQPHLGPRRSGGGGGGSSRNGSGRGGVNSTGVAANAALYDGHVLPAILKLNERLRREVSDAEPQDLALSLWSHANLDYHDEPLFQLLCDELRQRCSNSTQLKPVDVAHVMTSFRKLGLHCPDLLTCFVQVVLDQLSECKPEELMIITLGFARTGHQPGKVFLEAVVDSLQWSLQRYGPQETSLMLHSFAVLRHKPPKRCLQMMEGRLRRFLTLSDALLPVDMAQTVWAFGRFRYKPAALLDELPAYMAPRLHLFKPYELAIVLNGYASSRHFHKELLNVVATHVIIRPAALAAQDVSVLLHAYGIFRYTPTEPLFLDTMAAVVARRLKSLRPQGIAMIIKAFSNLQYRPLALIKDMVRVADARLPDFKPEELSAMLYGLAAMQLVHELPIFHAAVRQVIRILQEPVQEDGPKPPVLDHRIINSIVASCQQVGYTPWTLIDYAESQGIRVRNKANHTDGGASLLQLPAVNSYSQAPLVSASSWQSSSSSRIGAVANGHLSEFRPYEKSDLASADAAAAMSQLAKVEAAATAAPIAASHDTMASSTASASAAVVGEGAPSRQGHTDQPLDDDELETSPLAGSPDSQADSVMVSVLSNISDDIPLRLPATQPSSSSSPLPPLPWFEGIPPLPVLGNDAARPIPHTAFALGRPALQRGPHWNAMSAAAQLDSSADSAAVDKKVMSDAAQLDSSADSAEFDRNATSATPLLDRSADSADLDRTATSATSQLNSSVDSAEFDRKVTSATSQLNSTGDSAEPDSSTGGMGSPGFAGADNGALPGSGTASGMLRDTAAGSIFSGGGASLSASGDDAPMSGATASGDAQNGSAADGSAVTGLFVGGATATSNAVGSGHLLGAAATGSHTGNRANGSGGSIVGLAVGSGTTVMGSVALQAGAMNGTLIGSRPLSGSSRSGYML